MLFCQLRDRLCGEADLGSSFADAEKHISFETDIAGKKEILQYVNTDSCTTIVEVWGQHETILVFLKGTIFAITFCTHFEHGVQT